MKHRIETEHDKVIRLERQMSRLKFKQAKQRAVMEAEILRLTNHVDNGRQLLHKVTSEIGQKQDERDLANARLEAMDRMLVTMVKDTVQNRILVNMSELKNEKDRLLMIIEDGYIILTVEKSEGESDGETSDAITPVVSAPDEGTNLGQLGSDVLLEQEPGVPADQ